MRVGIYTLPLNYNYGGILQAYALQTTLEKMDHEPILLNRPFVRDINLWEHPRELVRRIIRKIKNPGTRILEEKYEKKVFPIITQNTNKFVNRYLKVINLNEADLSSKNENIKTSFDAIVVGSDQIWRAPFLRTSSNRYHSFLDFTEGWNIRRISYAASFGTDKWEYSSEETMKLRRLVSNFDAVSVRENSGVKLCQKYLDVQATHVLDPTLLLNKNEYLKLIGGNDDEPQKGKMMVYILDSSEYKDKLINRFGKILSLQPIKTNSYADDVELSVKERIQPPIEQWLRGFRDAEFVITDSFHACVFSIIFGKPFIVIGNKNRGMSRYESLLNNLGLQDRLITEDYEGGLPTSKITEAQVKLKEYINLSYHWLNNALK